MLSNTATPYYFGIFQENVLNGNIPVNREIAMEMNRIDKLIENPNIYYSPKAVEGFIKFCENELTLTDGSDLHLLPSFKLWAEQIFGWYYFENKSVFEHSDDYHSGRFVTKQIKKRLINKQFLIVGRGAAKTLYAECIQAYFLLVDTTTTDQIVTSPTMIQSEETMSPLKTAISRAKGPLINFLITGTSTKNTTGAPETHVKLAPTKEGIKNFLTNSVLRIRPMSIDKLQGLRCKVATLDEWLSCDIRENPIGAIEQGASKNPDYLILSTSSEGTVRNGCGDTIKMELMKILKGEYNDPHTSIWHYKLDNLSELNDPNMWIKANPNLGQTVTYDTYKRELERAEKNPSTRNDTLAKRFGLPMEGYTYFFTYEETIPHPKQTYWKMPCSLGIDLSMGDDFCSFSFLFPFKNETFGIKTRNYITSNTFLKLPLAMKTKYETFISEGSLIVLEGTILDNREIYEDLEMFIEQNQYDVCCIGYDPYNAKYFIDRWIQENGPYGVEVVRQGAKTESVPLGELKKLAEQRMLLFDEEIMSFALGNCITLEDTNGNRKLYKRKREQKIDPVAATMDAYISYKINKDFFE